MWFDSRVIVAFIPLKGFPFEVRLHELHSSRRRLGTFTDSLRQTAHAEQSPQPLWELPAVPVRVLTVHFTNLPSH